MLKHSLLNLKPFPGIESVRFENCDEVTFW